MVPMTDNHIILEELLARLKNLELGEEIRVENLGFTVFRSYNGELVERKDRRLSGELGIRLMNRRESWLDYDISSDDTRYVILSKEDWQLSEGSTGSYPISVEPFLRIPLLNFPTGSEARIYVPVSEKMVARN